MNKQVDKYLDRECKKGERMKRCLCRGPKKHEDCCSCGRGWEPNICGVCKEAGIDGKVIRGTERRICKKHQEKK